jgi:tetratricopeptide (TPR) repeat protein
MALGLVLAAVLAAAPAAAGVTACGGQHGGHGAPGDAGAAVEDPGPLGRIEFPTSAGAEAQEHFLRGVLWLHSFEYPDARAAFRRAREAEPGFALAAWGEAMTHNHPIWVQVDVEAGREALETLGKTREERLAAAPAERERAYLAAIEELYFGAGDKEERDRAYAEAMGRLHRRWPDDREAAAFYALALLGSRQGERDFAVYMRAAAVVEEVYLVNPDHPGALHYLIHAYDEAVHAPLGLRAARRYAEVASAAPHALHMPSHIFLALGMWDAVEASNRDSWQASLDRGRPSYHAYSWLHYALLQQGRLAEATELLERVAADAEGGAGDARGHLASMGAAQAIATGGRAAPPAVDLDGVYADAAVAARFAEGYRAALAGDAAGARAAAAAIREEAEGETGRSAGAAAVSADQLEALALLADAGAGSDAPMAGSAGGPAAEKALAVLRAAADAEGALSLDIGPPHPVKPTAELLGETLMALQRPAEAQTAFERALELAPGRMLALQGLAEAAAAAGDAEAAEEARGRLAANLRGASATGTASGGGVE